MQDKKRIISKAFGSITLGPRTNRVCSIMPPNTPYFEPKRCRVVCVDPSDPNSHQDVKISAVTVGGSPQLAMNWLNPDERSPGLRPEDLDYVNWTEFSMPGLARELQFHMYNPNDRRVAAFVCVEGMDLHNLDCADPCAPDNDEKRKRREESRIEADKQRSRLWVEAKRRQDEINETGWQQLSGNELELEPLEQRVIKIEPTTSPYFEPHRIRFHGHRIDGGASVPFTIIDAFCGDRVMYGTALEDLFSQRTVSRKGYPIESPQELLRKLTIMVDVLSKHGPSGLEIVQDAQRPAMVEDTRGMLTTHIVGEKGWGDVSWWPTCSCESLGRVLGVVAYNPWPFRIRASVSMEGSAVSSLCQEPEISTGDDALLEGSKSDTSENG